MAGRGSRWPLGCHKLCPSSQGGRGPPAGPGKLVEEAATWWGGHVALHRAGWEGLAGPGARHQPAPMLSPGAAQRPTSEPRTAGAHLTRAGLTGRATACGAGPASRAVCEARRPAPGRLQGPQFVQSRETLSAVLESGCAHGRRGAPLPGVGAGVHLVSDSADLPCRLGEPVCPLPLCVGGGASDPAGGLCSPPWPPVHLSIRSCARSSFTGPTS